MKQPAIRFEGFGFQYRSQARPTLHDINLTIYEGEKVLIVGPSGSGKSTLGNAVNGLIPFSVPGEITGRLEVMGKDASGESVFELSKVVGTVLQDTDGQFIGLTVGEDIAFSLENECVPQEEMFAYTSRAAELVGIGGYLEAAPHELSGGQKQRASMAGVIVDRVRILLFDEPLANLDPATGKQAVELIDRLQKETDTTVIIIEHRLEDALHRPVDRIILMDDGRIVADAAPDTLLCSGLLSAHGIREPLYLTALRYCGISPGPEQAPSGIGSLVLEEEHLCRVRDWNATVAPPPPPPPGGPLLEVSGLTFSYGEDAAGRETDVLRDVSFTLRRGESVAVVGTNGAGKSTLSKVICGFETPKSGAVLLEGRDLAGDAIPERAKRIGYVMQNPNQMISKAMIFDEVALGLCNLGMDSAAVAARVEDTLRVCGLYPFRNWPVSALSFGQKKRVTIASILALRPEVLILDEPTAGQDFRHYTEIMTFLEALRETGMTLIMITHDMHLMLEYTERSLVFSEGRLIADSTPAKILTDPVLSRRASLKETSLYHLAERCGIGDASGFVQRFIDYDREVRGRE